MDRRAVVQRFLEAGILATPELVAQTTEQNIESMIASAAQPKQQPAGAISPELEPGQHQTRLTVSDVAATSRRHFAVLRELLSKRVSAVSLQHAKPGDVAVIGRVRELHPDGFVLDDGTGSILVASTAAVDREDVIGIRGTIRDNTLQASDVLAPDVPLNRKRPVLQGTVTLHATGSDLAADKLPDVAHIRLRQADEQALLLFARAQDADPKTAIRWLQKRRIDRGFDSVLIDPVPDIFWVHAGRPFSHVYKGVLIVSPGDGKATVDLAAGSVVFAAI